MHATAHSRTFWPLAAALGAALFLSACADGASIPTDPALAPGATAEARGQNRELNRALAELRRATARYHRLDAALADSFVFLHECEERPGEEPVGVVYVHFGRLLDGIIDPAAPDGLIYEPGPAGRMELVGVELAVPFALWAGQDPPDFFGARFQPEQEFGVFGLHVWLWRHNPDGMFAAGNPRVSCEPERSRIR